MRFNSRDLQHQVVPQHFPAFPLDWASIFGRSAPLAVEVGFGNGGYMERRARDQRDWNFVGIELSSESMKRLMKRVSQAGLPNVRVIHDDARWVLRECFADDSVDQVVMLYPDPWPKDRHRHRRLLDEQFRETLSAVLRNSGHYELVTDQRWYAEHAHQLFSGASDFEVSGLVENPNRPVDTKYERKWQQIGRDAFRVQAGKRGSVAIRRLLENDAMPHSFVNGRITPEHVQQLRGREHRETDAIFVVKDAYAGLSHSHFLLRVVARDGTYQQKFFVAVGEDTPGRWLVKLDHATLPYRTPGVKNAVWKVGEWLSEMAVSP